MEKKEFNNYCKIMLFITLSQQNLTCFLHITHAESVFIYVCSDVQHCVCLVRKRCVNFFQLNQCSGMAGLPVAFLSSYDILPSLSYPPPPPATVLHRSVHDSVTQPRKTAKVDLWPRYENKYIYNIIQYNII